MLSDVFKTIVFTLVALLAGWEILTILAALILLYYLCKFFSSIIQGTKE